MTASSGDHGDELDVDAAWAQIVAHWEQEAAAEDRLSVDQGNLDLRGGAHPVARPITPENRRVGEHSTESAHPEPAPELPGSELPEPPVVGRGGRHIAEPTVSPDPTPEPLPIPDPPELNDHFIPELEEGSPFPTSWVARVGWACLVGAPLFFLFTAIFWRDAPGYALVLAAVALLLGFALLVISLPNRPKDDPGPDDDGAVV